MMSENKEWRKKYGYKRRCYWIKLFLRVSRYLLSGLGVVTIVGVAVRKEVLKDVVEFIYCQKNFWEIGVDARLFIVLLAVFIAGVCIYIVSRLCYRQWGCRAFR